MSNVEKPTIETLRERVVAGCEQNLRELAGREGHVDPETFLSGLRERHLSLEEWRRVGPPMIQVERMLRQLTSLLDRAQAALTPVSDPRLGPEHGLTVEQIAALSSREDLQPILKVLAHLREHPDLELKKYEHKDRPANLPDDEEWPPMPDENLNRRRIVAAHATDNFLGLRRPPTIRELAVLYLYLDPEHGCTERRYRRDEGTNKPPMMTFYDVLKAEMDTISKVADSEKLAKIKRES